MTDWTTRPDVGEGRCACGAPLVKVLPTSPPTCIRSGWMQDFGCGSRPSPSTHWLDVAPGALAMIAKEALRDARAAYRRRRSEVTP